MYIYFFYNKINTSIIAANIKNALGRKFLMNKIISLIILSYVTVSFALQGGPTQPDYIEFEPSDMSDMVSLTSGNFSYSIPLGEVPGAYGSYPLSISYHAGISPQKEASWVGLGWSLSPGSIVRDLRGVPDDQFHGGTLGFIYQYSALYTWSMEVDLAFPESYVSVGVRISNTNGAGFNATNGIKVANIADVGFAIDTDLGIGVYGQVGFENGLGLNASAMFSPKSEDWMLSAGASMRALGKKRNLSASLGVQYTTGQDVAINVGMSAISKESKTSSKIIGASFRSNGASASLGPVSVSVANSSSKGGWNHSSTGFSIVIPTTNFIFSLGFNQTLHEYHMRSATSDYVYGFMYQGGPTILEGGSEDENHIEDIPGAQKGFGKSKGRIPWDWTFKGRTLESLGNEHMHPAYDLFTVESEGIAGTFRAFPREEHQMLNLVSYSEINEDKKTESYHPILNLDANRNPHSEEFVYKNEFDYQKTERMASEYPSYKVNETIKVPYADYKTEFRNEGNRMVYRTNKNSEEPLSTGMNFLFIGEGGYYESEKNGAAKGRPVGIVSDSLLKRTLNNRQYALYGSRKVEPIFEDNSPVSKIKGFVVTNSNGTKYFFTQPVKSYLKVDYTINQEKGMPVFVDRKLSQSKDLGEHILDVVQTALWPPKLIKSINKALSGKLDEKCKADYSDETYLFSYQVNMNPYATQWLLKEIQGADFIQLDKEDMTKNLGYNVKFNYTEPSLYQWRTPYAPPNTRPSDMPNYRVPRNGETPVGCDTKMYRASFGVKEYVYLESIETATHKVEFKLNNPQIEERADGKGWYFNRFEKTNQPQGEDALEWVWWNLGNINNNDKRTLPILTTAALSLKIKSLDPISQSNLSEQFAESQLNTYKVFFEHDALYVNVEIPDLIQKYLREHPKLVLETDYSKKSIHIGYGNSLYFKNNEFYIEVDNEAENMIEKTSGNEVNYGLYKIKLKQKSNNILVWEAIDDGALFKDAIKGNVKIVLGENGRAEIFDNQGNTISDDSDAYKLSQCKTDNSIWKAIEKYTGFCANRVPLISPILDWADIIFAGNNEDPSVNQMRYLKKISYYNKKYKEPYREYDFEYDYSLHPKTLNSYCGFSYPKDLSDIQSSPNNAQTNVCSTNETTRNLYGKLTLKSISEKSCQNGRCAVLPPFKFDYNAAAQTSTRIGSKENWTNLSESNVPKIFFNKELFSNREKFFSDDYYVNFTDIDASMVASENAIDEWGFWNNKANEDNHKVNQSFADYGAAAWSLNKITDPAGGIMEIKYERDVYKDGEDHSNEHFYIPVHRIGKCSSFKNIFKDLDSKYNNQTCALFLPLYWNDQCLGARPAYWSYSKPKEYNGSPFDYMDELRIVEKDKINNEKTVYFNFRSELQTEVECGLFGAWDCDRFRNVGLFGSANFEEMYEGFTIVPSIILNNELSLNKILKSALSTTKVRSRLLVLDKEYAVIHAGLQLAADKINNEQDWENGNISGSIWAKPEASPTKGGDLRVKELVRYDIDRVAKTEYEYEPGEIAQLPDSAYNTVLGNRFNVNLISYAMPDVNIKPKSRIVGFNDDDLLYVPGSSIMYPKVTVKNSDDSESIANGKTEYEFITPEKGIPEEYIDSLTKKNLIPFIRLNVNQMVWNGTSLENFGYTIARKYFDVFKTSSIVATVEFYDSYDQILGSPMNVVLYRNKVVPISFYNENVKDVKKIKIIHGDGSQNILNIDKLNDFNEIAVTLAYIRKKWYLHKNWQRSQEQGYIPILYKYVTYRDEETDLLKINTEKNDPEIIKKAILQFEDSVRYHDFTAFLGLNTKTSFYRGNGDKNILLKVDSSVYSTSVPDVLTGIAEGSDVTAKIGKQIERWRSSRELQCINGKRADCVKSDRSLSVHKPDSIYLIDKYGKQLKKKKVYFNDSVSFEYKRYPVFQVASITSKGYDDQESRATDQEKKSMHQSVIENHKFDPVTSKPTASLAKIPAPNGKELRKLTVKLPHHAVKDSYSTTDLAARMFRKNMLSQNYADFVYFDSIAFNKNSPWNSLEKVMYLKSFSMTPLNKFNNPIMNSSSDLVQVSENDRPYIEWGTFTSRRDPRDILGGPSLSDNAPYIFAAQYQDIHLSSSSANWPSQIDFDGKHILKMDDHFRPTEIQDVFNRITSVHYSNNELREINLFYPTSINKTAAIVPVGDEITIVNMNLPLTKNSNSQVTECNDCKNVDFDKGGWVVTSPITINCSVLSIDCDSTLVAEYKIRKYGQEWLTERKSAKEMNLALASGDVLNYLRIYPEYAESKTYIYDRYGNIIQIVAEDNTSTYYEYNPFGELILARNDDGVSFKSHHREFMNDNRNEIPWTESINSSPAIGNQ